MRNKHILHPTLYTPATTPPDKVINLLYTRKLPVWRLVICTEDSIQEDDVTAGISNIAATLPQLLPGSRKTVFVRVRNPEVLARVLDLPGADQLTGFVIPKADPDTFQAYADQVLATGGPKYRLMPILESSRMTDFRFRDDLREMLADLQYRSRIDCLRIGANDLMGHLGIRRDTRSLTVYDTPVGATIFSIINEFKGLSGFNITAPVFECFDSRYDDLLLKEVHQHIQNGLFGQTVIHTRHLRIIRDSYRVPTSEYRSAEDMLAHRVAVKGVAGRMDEHSTHWRNAQMVVYRHDLFGSTQVEERDLEPALSAPIAVA